MTHRWISETESQLTGLDGAGNWDDVRHGDWLHLTASLPSAEEVTESYEAFWTKTEVKEFPRDENGKHLRDENGDIVVIRTDIPRRRPKSELYFKNQKRKNKTNENNGHS